MVDNADSAESNEQKIQEEKGILTDQQVFIFERRKLLNDCLLYDYNIQNKDIFLLHIHNYSDLKVFLKDIFKENISFDVEIINDLKSFKQKILEKERTLSV